jgi:8-amino-7-oxononanoate synthase
LGAAVEVLTLHTCGKALGVSGALICGARVMIETLINRARSFIFATAPSPFDAALVRAALTALSTRPELQGAAIIRIEHAHREALRLCDLDGRMTQIMPVIIGTDGPTMARAADLQARGFDVRGIRPPTVPRGTSRLRISITGNVTKDDITSLFEAIARQQEAL